VREAALTRVRIGRHSTPHRPPFSTWRLGSSAPYSGASAGWTYIRTKINIMKYYVLL